MPTSNYTAVPITLRKDLHAFFIIGNSKFKIYCMLSKGKLPLLDSKTTRGDRSIQCKRGDIICLYADPETGYEEFCGLDETGQTTSNVKFRHSIPIRFRERVQRWCRSNPNLISKIKKGKIELPKKVFDVKSIKFSENLKRKFKINDEKDTED